MLLDMLNRPISVGDTVLTKGYGSAAHDFCATVQKINRTTVVVQVNKSYLKYDAALQKHVRVAETSPMRRNPKDCIVVTEQLAYNRATYPECTI